MSTSVLNLSDLGNAIGTAEGFGVPNAIPTLANNPGDLEIGDIGYGTMGQGITVFPDAQSGTNALNSQLASIFNGNSNNYNPNMTIAQMGQTWAGGGQGSTNWSNNVSNSLGASPSSTLSSLFGSNPSVGSTTSSGGGVVSQLLNGGGASLAGTAVSSLLTSRVASFIIGIICIGAGLLMLKSTQTIIETAGKAGTKIAELSA
jgi:hypothetical protein